jgi:arylsulfatase A-like enzyme
MHLYRFIAAFVIAGGLAFAQTPVILISIDTLRADHLSAYGYNKIQTQNIDAFAHHGTVFTTIDSQIPLTLPSHTCLFTSTYPFESGVEENAEIVPASVVTLASVLQAHGYRTGAFIGSDLLAQRFKLDKGFDVYDSPFRPQANPYDARVRRDAALVVRSGLQWLNSGGKPPFLFLHFFDLHAPYLSSTVKSLQPNVAGYDDEIQHVDHVMERLRQALMEKGWWDRALIIVLSDHGESLGEHGETSHGYFVYQSTLHVPLLVHWPASLEPLPAKVSLAGGLIDVAPTVLDVLHIQAPPSFRGNSLLKSLPHPVYSESMYAYDAFRWSPLRSIRTENFQYIDAPEAELYNLANDPRELKNAIHANATQSSELRTSLRTLLASAPHASAVSRDSSADTAATLGSLGYVSGSTRTSSSKSGADPKARLAEYQTYDRGLEALYDHRETDAIPILSGLLKHDPKNTVARYYLGEAYLRMGRRDDAVREWKAALAEDPNYQAASEAIQKADDAKR